MDFDGLMGIMAVMSLFTEEPGPRFSHEDLHNPGLRAVKGAIPRVDYRHQRTIGIMLKLIELRQLMESYGSQVPQNSDRWRRQMLQELRPYLSEERRELLDTLVRLMDMKAVMGLMPQ